MAVEIDSLAETAMSVNGGLPRWSGESELALIGRGSPLRLATRGTLDREPRKKEP